MSSNEAVVEHVARIPGAIGYVSTLWTTESDVDGVRVLPVEGVSPTPTTISDGSYPLSRSLIWRPSPSQPAKAASLPSGCWDRRGRQS
jgi:phosphate transport system substrate-binding protein